MELQWHIWATNMGQVAVRQRIYQNKLREGACRIECPTETADHWRAREEASVAGASLIDVRRYATAAYSQLERFQSIP